MTASKQVNLIGFYIFSVIAVIIGIFLFFFPPESISYPDKKMGGAYVVGFGIFNIIFIAILGHSKIGQSFKSAYFYIIESILVAAFFSAIIGFMGMFQKVEWYDTFTHLFIPLVGAFFVYMIFFGLRPDAKFSFGVILVFSLAMIGLIFLWEFLEVMVEQYTHYSLWLTNGDQNDFRDDVVAGFIGIALGTVISAFKIKPLLARLKIIS